jgi:hypothetical protein
MAVKGPSLRQAGPLLDSHLLEPEPRNHRWSSSMAWVPEHRQVRPPWAAMPPSLRPPYHPRLRRRCFRRRCCCYSRYYSRYCGRYCSRCCNCYCSNSHRDCCCTHCSFETALRVSGGIHLVSVHLSGSVHPVGVHLGRGVQSIGLLVVLRGILLLLTLKRGLLPLTLLLRRVVRRATCRLRTAGGAGGMILGS